MWAALAVSSPIARADNWPQWLGPQRDSVWRETGIVQTFPKEGLKIRWRTPIGGGYAGPAVANGRVYVMDRTLPAGEGPLGGGKRGSAATTERILCLSEADGKVLWKHEYPCVYTIAYPGGPRTTPAIADGKVYTLGAQSDLFCLDAESGKVLWSHHLLRDYNIFSAPTWGFASNPLVDGKKVIVLAGGKNSTAVAFDKDTGKEIWHALNDDSPGHGPGYGSPIIIEAGGCRQLIVWHPEALSSVDPETGKVLWEQPFRLQSGLSLATPRKMDDLLFVSAFYNGSLMMKLDAQKPAATVLWQRKGKSERSTDALHCLINTPFLDNGYIYGVDSYGELRCLDAKTGDRLWQTLAATGSKGTTFDRWATAFIVKNADRFFLFNEKGDLIIARLTPKGYDEVSRVHLLEPTNTAQRRNVVWSHPAFANRCVYVRNDKEIVCGSLAAEDYK